MVQAYSNEQLFEISRDNYQTLQFHCVKLNSEGFWEQSGKVLKQSIGDMLDMYVQSFLVLYTLKADNGQADNYEFIKKVTDKNMLNLTERGISEEDLKIAQRIMNAPPILIQLFCLRDNKLNISSSKLFVDTLINVLIAMAYLNQQQGNKVIDYIKNYFNKMSAFFTDDSENWENIDDKFIFRRICNVNFKTGYMECEMPIEAAPEEESYAAQAKKESLEEIHEKDSIESENLEKEIHENDSAEKENLEKESKEKAVAVAKENILSEAQLKAKKEEAAQAAKEARREMEAAREAKRAAAVDKLMKELDSLIGLKAVKKEMNSLVNLIKVRKMRNTYDMPIIDMSYHMVFTGNPGTGKTTVARLVAEIYKELGVLSKGTFIETDRSGLVAPYIGQTALKVQEVVDKAKGGVLFIDEAYSLAEGDTTSDFGKEAIDTLVKLMEDNRNDLVIIVAGYKEEMEEFLKINPGLISRFNKFINFEDYSDPELVAILDIMADKYNFVFEKKAITKLKRKLKAMDIDKKKDFGNARGIRNMFENIVTNQANRIVQLEDATKEQLSLVLAEDV